MSRRDDFTKKTVELLSRRAGGRCSMCSCPTWGPNDSPYSATNIGQAAHIAAAAEGGPRYDSSMSSEERTSVKNGIWLCSNCHDKIDRNVASYNTKTLHQLKKRTASGKSWLAWRVPKHIPARKNCATAGDHIRCGYNGAQEIKIKTFRPSSEKETVL